MRTASRSLSPCSSSASLACTTLCKALHPHNFTRERRGRRKKEEEEEEEEEEEGVRHREGQKEVELLTRFALSMSCSGPRYRALLRRNWSFSSLGVDTDGSRYDEKLSVMSSTSRSASTSIEFSSPTPPAAAAFCGTTSSMVLETSASLMTNVLVSVQRTTSSSLSPRIHTLLRGEKAKEKSNSVHSFLSKLKRKERRAYFAERRSSNLSCSVLSRPSSATRWSSNSIRRNLPGWKLGSKRTSEEPPAAITITQSVNLSGFKVFTEIESTRRSRRRRKRRRGRRKEKKTKNN